MSNLSIIEQETAAFELVQRHAKMFASSTLVPKEFQGNMANCAIGLNIAKRLGADPFMVIQNVDIIHGRPSFRATFLIAMVNASARFSPLQFRMSGEGANRTCVAHCKSRETGDAIEGPEISMSMAKAEGWSTKAGSKWLTMPELMLRYRAAAFFARLYAPDITLGMQTSEELLDIESPPRYATGRVVSDNPMARIAEPSQAFEDLPGESQEDSCEPQTEAPPQDLERIERQSLLTDIGETCAECEITQATFGGKAKRANYMEAKDSVLDVAIESLRKIHDNRLAIAKS